jgi:hypothetical protein
MGCILGEFFTNSSGHPAKKHKIHQNFPFQGTQKCVKIGIFGLIYMYHLAPLVGNPKAASGLHVPPRSGFYESVPVVDLCRIKMINSFY